MRGLGVRACTCKCMPAYGNTQSHIHTYIRMQTDVHTLTYTHAETERPLPVT